MYKGVVLFPYSPTIFVNQKLCYFQMPLHIEKEKYEEQGSRLSYRWLLNTKVEFSIYQRLNNDQKLLKCIDSCQPAT